MIKIIDYYNSTTANNTNTIIIPILTVIINSDNNSNVIIISNTKFLLELIPRRYCCVITHQLYPSCHNNSWMQRVTACRQPEHSPDERNGNGNMTPWAHLQHVLQFDWISLWGRTAGTIKTYRLDKRTSFLLWLVVRWAHLLLFVQVQDGSTCGQPRHKWWCT